MLIWQLCLQYKNCMCNPFVIFCSAGHSVDIGSDPMGEKASGCHKDFFDAWKLGI